MAGQLPFRIQPDFQFKFGTRASLMRDDLDQNGQDSKDFDAVMFNFIPGNYKQVRTIAASIEKLANNLPD
jgi:hypothetical protein